MLLLAGSMAVMFTVQPDRLRAPAAVAYGAAAIVALCGGLALARGYRRPALADGLVCAALGGMLLMQLWVALGPGPRNCVGRLHFLAPGTPVSDLACRSAFGMGSVVVAGMLVVAVRAWLRRQSRD